ncbi:MAG: mechanosensitive ion channel family protein [Actinomycetota bacterium]|nr:mechanosensitive ion channel family protein [Actinomycetota bacterium]
MRVLEIDVSQVTDWLSGSPGGALVSVVVILVLTVAVLWLWRRFVRHTTSAVNDSSMGARLAATGVAADPLTAERYRARTNAVAGLITSVGVFVIVGVGVIAALARLGVNVAPILASAGVAGIAIGFGAQTIVRDFLSGVFMILENQYGVGDLITVNAITGTVEEVGLRITRIRDFDGTVWYVTNGSVTELGNLSQGWSLAVVDVPVGYGADPEVVTQELQRVATDMRDDDAWSAKILPDDITVAAEVMTPMAVTFRIRVHTVPNQHWAVARELRVRALDAMEQAGVPSPTRPVAPEDT